jgi:hypothetical protein
MANQHLAGESLRQKASYVEIGASLQYEFEKEGFGKVKP